MQNFNIFNFKFYKLKKTLSILLILLINSNITAQNSYTISGYITDKSSGENLIGATIIAKPKNEGTSSNAYGFYSITLEEGEYNLEYSYIGYENIYKKITLDKDIRLNLELNYKSKITQEIKVTSEKSDQNIESTNVSQIKLDLKQTKEIPVVFGENDILKTIQLLPGVQTAGEGLSGFYVRGGGPDQNLILLDEATVYNATHLFGFASVFNSDAIKNVTLIKGGMPANYSGRLSSVLDISLKDGNYQDYEFEGGIGLLSSRILAEGPILKNKSSFILSARRTYIDVLVMPFVCDTCPGKGSGYFFYDLTAKINYKISDKDRIYLSGYMGKDVFSYENLDRGFKVKFPWGNKTASLRWNHLFNNKLFCNSSIIFTDYQYEFGIEQSFFEFKILSGIKDINAKVDFTYLPNSRNQIKFGSVFTNHKILPGIATGQAGETSFEPDEISEFKSNEMSFYALNDYTLSDNIKINFGLVYSLFQYEDLAKFNIFKYDSLTQYRNIEPRISFRVKIKPDLSFKGSYNENYQYLHLASVSSISLPTDLWIPSSINIKPQFARQYVLGFFKNLFDNSWETSIEGYYKDLDNLIDYKEGVYPEDYANESSDAAFTFGKGESYGLELFVKKTSGKTNGWLGYTHSYTTRNFEELNDGKEFFAKYDRRHDLSITVSHKINDKLSLSSVFVYATGNAITIPSERYVVDGELFVEYSDRNAFRMEPYHRLDLSVNYTPKKSKKVNSSWNFSIYNVYNKKNPFFMYYDFENSGSGSNSGNILEGNLEPKLIQVSLFPILPSITWNFKF